MPKTWTVMPLSAAAMLLTLGNAQAQELSEVDREFIETAAQSGHAEVAAAQTAKTSENQAVAAFAQQMIDEHTKMNEELATLAQKKGVQPPDSPDLASQAKTAVTGALPGSTFDKQYVSSQLDDHHETLELLQNQLREGQDPELKAFAEKHIPIVEKHMGELADLQQRPELQ
jgi:putative membrane protein